MFASEEKGVWDIHLFAALKGINSQLHSITNYIQFELMFGRSPASDAPEPADNDGLLVDKEKQRKGFSSQPSSWNLLIGAHELLQTYTQKFRATSSRAKRNNGLHTQNDRKSG